MAEPLRKVERKKERKAEGSIVYYELMKADESTTRQISESDSRHVVALRCEVLRLTLQTLLLQIITFVLIKREEQIVPKLAK